MQVIWTKKANHNLTQLEQYIAKDNPIAAVDTSLEIINTVELLSEHPELGRPGRVFGTRELVIANTPYIVAYRVQNNCLSILRIIHGAMEWPGSL